MPAKKNCQYSSSALKNALEAIKNGMPIKKASQEYKIPKTTLHCKFHGKYPIECKVGAPTILTKEEEDTLVQWIIRVAQAGFPVSREQLLESVFMLLTKSQRPNPFKNNMPGRHWYEGFLRRHTEISRRMTQNLVHSRAIITEQSIRKWFDEVHEYLEKENLIEVLNDPRRIFNADESAFFLCPKGKKALALKGSKAVYNNTANDEKECITTLVTANAAGELPPPMVMFAYQRIPQSIVTLMPDNWGLGKSESGWMTGESFFEFVSNVFHPWLLRNDIPLPVIFYVDGHKSHLTLHLSEFCSQNGVILISLFPNSTHILQPMDVGVFHPLKNGWKKAVTKFRNQTNKQKIRKENFAPLLDTVIKDVVNAKMLQNAFKTCGLFPFNPNAINYNKLVTTANNTKNHPSNNEIEHIEFNNKQLDLVETLIDRSIEKNLTEEFRIHNSNGRNWTGPSKHESLFILWKELNEYVRTKIVIPITSDVVPDQVIQIAEDMPEDVLVLEADWLGDILTVNNENQEIPEATNLKGTVSADVDHDNNWTIQEKNATSQEQNIEEDNEEATRDECSESLEEHATSNGHVSEAIEKGVNSSNKQDVINNDIDYFNDSETNPYEDGGAIDNSFDKDINENINTTNETSSNNANSELPFDVPSPFKGILFWPQKQSIATKKKISIKIPSVASSEQWKAFYRKKQEEKDKKEEEKDNRKRKREAKREETSLKKSTKVTKRGKTAKNAKRILFEDDHPSDEDLSDSGSELMTENPANNDRDRVFKIGDYVIVNYDNKKFPGVINDIKPSEASVSTMIPSGTNWKWPSKKDVLWYENEDICEKINEPILSNKRGCFVVPEIKQYEEFKF